MTLELKNFGGSYNCITCQKEIVNGKEQFCPECGLSAYCSADCQKANVTDHKLTCKKNKGTSEAVKSFNNFAFQILKAVQWEKLNHAFMIITASEHYKNPHIELIAIRAGYKHCKDPRAATAIPGTDEVFVDQYDFITGKFIRAVVAKPFSLLKYRNITGHISTSTTPEKLKAFLLHDTKPATKDELKAL